MSCFYSGMWEKGLARCSWQKGSLLTVQISVSYGQCQLPVASTWASYTHRLQVLLDLSIESTCLERNDLRSSIGVVGDGRAALGAEETVDNVA